MFLDNHYTKEYYNIIEKNQNKTAGMSIRKIKLQFGYTEKHHIIPRAIGGTDQKENTVYMPASEHFRCHQLLVNMLTGVDKGKMWNGLWRMMNKQSKNQERNFIITPNEYEIARVNSANAHRERFSGENNPFYNQKHTNDTLKAMSVAKKGKSYEEIFGESYAKEMRLKRSQEQLGRKKGKQQIVKCNYCDVIGGTGIMKRWHGKKCKHYHA